MHGGTRAGAPQTSVALRLRAAPDGRPDCRAPAADRVTRGSRRRSRNRTRCSNPAFEPAAHLPRGGCPGPGASQGNRIRDCRCVVMAELGLAGVDFRVRSAEIGPTIRLEGRLRRPAGDSGRCGRRVPSKCDWPGMRARVRCTEGRAPLPFALARNRAGHESKRRR